MQFRQLEQNRLLLLANLDLFHFYNFLKVAQPYRAQIKSWKIIRENEKRKLLFWVIVMAETFFKCYWNVWGLSSRLRELYNLVLPPIKKIAESAKQIVETHHDYLIISILNKVIERMVVITGP